MTKILLYQYENCPFCIRVRNKLDEMGLKFVKVEVDPDDKPDVVMKSTGGSVPVMDIDGEIIGDSARIIDYLEEHFGKKE